MIYLSLLYFYLFNFNFHDPLIVPKGNIEIHVKGIKNIKGTILASLFQSDDGFPGDKEKAVEYKVVKVENDTVVIHFPDLQFGTYAIVLFHDENNNKKLDTNFIGIPKEGLGTTNNAKPKFRAPKFEEASFQLENSLFKAEVELIYY